MTRSTRARWSQRGRDTLRETARHIALENPGAARRWIQRIRRRANEAAAMPLAGRKVPELGREDVREVFVGAYRIVYQTDGKGALVLVVFEGHRLFPGP